MPNSKLHREETESVIKDRKRHQSALIWREIEALRGQSVAQLRGKYLEVFGYASRSNHKQFLVRRIAWRLQANAEGDLSQRARERALALAEEADLRIQAPEFFVKRLSGPAGKKPSDPRLPPAGNVLTRQFHGENVSVEVLEDGFRYQEQVYKSLSAVARHVTGVQWNGFAFFALKGNVERQHGW